MSSTLCETLALEAVSLFAPSCFCRCSLTLFLSTFHFIFDEKANAFCPPPPPPLCHIFNNEQAAVNHGNYMINLPQSPTESGRPIHVGEELGTRPRSIRAKGAWVETCLYLHDQFRESLCCELTFAQCVPTSWCCIMTRL